jgi:hypothetical protein
MACLPAGGLEPTSRQLLIFNCLNPFDLLVKERFLFDWERKYNTVSSICNAPVNIFSTIRPFTYENKFETAGPFRPFPIKIGMKQKGKPKPTATPSVP